MRGYLLIFQTIYIYCFSNHSKVRVKSVLKTLIFVIENGSFMFINKLFSDTLLI